MDWSKTIKFFETKIQGGNIAIYKNDFILECYIELKCYKDKNIRKKLFKKKCSYKTTCFFKQDAIQRNALYLENKSIECKDIPEIEFSKIPKP